MRATDLRPTLARAAKTGSPSLCDLAERFAGDGALLRKAGPKIWAVWPDYWCE